MLKKELIEDFFSRKIEFKGIERELHIPKIARKIISIVGPRRAGKTWLFYYLLQISAQKSPMYVNFEDIAFRNLSPEEFFNVIKIFSEIKYPPRTFFLDEIQVIEGWETLVRSLYDRNFKIFITGSSSALLSKEIATQLRGRALTYILLPFSFREFLNAKNQKNKDFQAKTFESRGRILRYLREYLKYGGFPEVVLSENKEKILNQYSNEIFYKDFVERHQIKSLGFGRFLFEFALQNFSKEISLKKIKRFFSKNISETTLYRYVEKLQDTMSIFFLEKYSRSVYQRRSWLKKMYICDTGLSLALGFSNDYGKKMENVVFLELMRKTNEHPLLSFYFWKDKDNEVDFVVKEGRKIKQLIQVTYVNSKGEIRKREIKSLLKLSKLTRCKRLLILTWDLEDKERVQNKKIEFLPLWKWLMRSKLLDED